MTMWLLLGIAGCVLAVLGIRYFRERDARKAGHTAAVAQAATAEIAQTKERKQTDADLARTDGDAVRDELRRNWTRK